MSCAPARARSVAGGPGCQTSSQIVIPTEPSPRRRTTRSLSLCEVPVLVEDAVVGEEVLAVHGLHATARAHGAGVREIAVEPGRPDQCHDALGCSRYLLQRRACGAHESGPEEKILGRVAGGGELGIHDEIGPCRTSLLERLEDHRAIAAEVADDRIQLRERDSQGFRLTVTNRV